MYKKADKQIRYYPPSNMLNRIKPMGGRKPYNTQSEVHVPGDQPRGVFLAKLLNSV